jgi:hypothetical protein
MYHHTMLHEMSFQNNYHHGNQSNITTTTIRTANTTMTPTTTTMSNWGGFSNVTDSQKGQEENGKDAMMNQSRRMMNVYNFILSQPYHLWHGTIIGLML